MLVKKQKVENKSKLITHSLGVNLVLCARRTHSRTFIVQHVFVCLIFLFFMMDQTDLETDHVDDKTDHADETHHTDENTPHRTVNN